MSLVHGVVPMQTLSALFIGLLLAVVLLAAIGTFISGVSQPEKQGSLAVAGAVLGGSVIIAMAIMSRGDNGER